MNQPFEPTFFIMFANTNGHLHIMLLYYSYLAVILENSLNLMRTKFYLTTVSRAAKLGNICVCSNFPQKCLLV